MIRNIRAKSACLAVVTIVSIACWAFPGETVAGTILRHSWTGNLAAGDFDGDGAADAAWILPGGDIRLYSPSSGTGGTVPGTAAYAVVGADLTPGGDGVHELVYLRRSDPNPAADQQIRVISVPAATDTQLPGEAGAASRLTSGDWDNDGDDGYVVTSRLGDVYGAEPTPGGIVYNSPSGVGQFVSWVGGDFVPGRPGDEFAGFNSGTVAYLYNGGTSNSYSLMNGSGLNAITAGNVDNAAAGDEVFALVRGTELWSWNSATAWARLPGSGNGPGAGSVDAALGGLDQWFVISSGPTYQILRYTGNPTWPSLSISAKDYHWQDFVLADFDGDNLDELLAIKRDTGAAYYIDPQTMNRYQRVAAFAQGPVVPVETGMQLWLDASDSSTIVAGTGGGVATWMDKSGNNFHATQTDPAKEPALNATAMGGQPAVRFDGVDDGLSIDDGLVVGRPYTVFTVDQLYGTLGRTLQSRDPGVNWLTGKWGGSNAHFADGFVYQGASGDRTTVPVIGDAVGYATSSGYMLNGINVTGSTAPLGSPGHLGLGSEGTYTAGELSQSDVAEVIVFDRALSLHERSQVGLYLRDKYGIAGYTAYNTHLATRETVFVGGDPGEGLDMQGNFVHAVNARGPGGMTVGDAGFTTDAGVISSEHEILNWINPNYGPSANDAGLATVMQSIRWTATDGVSPDTVDVNLPGLVPGRTYKVQMMFGDAATSRHFAVDIEGSRVIGDFQMGGLTGTSANLGGLITHQFVATDSTLNIVLDGRGLSPQDINPILQAVTVEDRGVTGRSWANTFTSAAPGAGLDTEGSFLYAVNMRGPGGLKVGDALFTADTATPGFSLNAEYEILNWINPSYGSTPDDDNLETVMQSIRWTATGNTRGEALSMDLAGLDIGQQYKLQLLFGESPSSRGFDLVINDILVADNFSPTAEGVGANTGVVFSYQFHANDDMLHVVLDGYSTNFGDTNPILNALTLEIVPEPSSAALLGLGLLGLLLFRRRKKR